MYKILKIRHCGLISLFCFVLTLNLVNSIAKAELKGWYVEEDPSNRVNLTEIGTADWAYWGTQSLEMANEKADAGEIGELTIIGTTSIDKSQWATSWDVDFSDGVEPVSGSVNNVGNRLRLESASDVDEGYEITVAAGAETRYLDIYIRQRNLAAKFVATLGNDSNEVTVEAPMGGNTHGIYRLDFSHPTASELRVRYFLPAGIDPYFGTEGDSMRFGCVTLSGPRGRAYKLYPKDDTIVSSTNVSLQWLPGDYVAADGHRVYFDPNEQKVTDRSGCVVNGVPTTDPSYTVVDLIVGETYYWAVDQVNGTDLNSPWIGDVSSFTVTAAIFGPSPQNEKKGVHPEIPLLEWNTGLAAATSYDVYLGTNWNEVNEGTGNTYQGTVTDPLWAVTPSLLAEMTTYYWRVDASDGTTTYKGNVWTFTTGAGVNIVWISDDFGGGLDHGWVAMLETQGYTVDYKKGVYWHTLDENKLADLDAAELVIVSSCTAATGIEGSYNDVNDNEPNQWNGITTPMIVLEASLTQNDFWNWFDSSTVLSDDGKGDVYMMEAVQLGHPLFDGVTFSGNKVDAIDEIVGSEYTDFIEVTTAGNGAVYATRSDTDWVWVVEWAKGAEFYDGADQTAGDRRMYFSAGTGGFNPGIYNLTPEGEKIFLNAVEYMRQPMLKAYAPYPFAGATDVKHSPTLGWTPGENAVQHDVYFGTEEAAVAGADTETSTIYRGRQDLASYVLTEAPLQWGKTYYWRIDEIEADGVTIRTGGIWSFTVADYLIIDDFEDYTNYQPDDIFSTWSDGYNIDENGALVGHDEPDFVETEIVHGGKQSMPYFYDNRGMAKYSEASRAVSGSKDWTREGVTELSLWFRGYPASTSSFVEGPAGTYTITASGEDIWNSSDEFHFAYKQYSGSGSIIAKVDSVQNTHEFAKAGVMIRDTLDPDSINTSLFITPENGVRFQYRQEKTGNTDREFVEGITAPQWVKLERSVGGLVRAYYSANGTTWQQFPTKTVTMSTPMYIGLAVTSHDAELTCEAKFSNVSFTDTNVDSQWSNQDIGLTVNHPEPMYVAVSNTNGIPVPVYHDNPDATLIDTWTEWTIDLKLFKDLGIDLTDIDRIYLGLGDKNNPQPGGPGTMFFDDIRLYRSREVAE